MHCYKFLSVPPMTKESQDILNKFRMSLIQGIITVEMVCNHLQQDAVLTKNLKELIMMETKRSSQVAYLLDVLPTRGEEAFLKFINVLMKHDYKDLAESLHIQRYHKSLLLPYEEKKLPSAVTMKRRYSVPFPGRAHPVSGRLGIQGFDVPPTLRKEVHRSSSVQETGYNNN